MGHLFKYFNLAIQNYANFKTRTSRKQFWLFQLTFLCIGLVLFIINSIFSAAIQHYVLLGTHAPAYLSIIFLIYSSLVALFYIFMIIPTIALQVRRLHDINRTGWFILLALIPIVGGIVLIVFYCLAGSQGENHYGPAVTQT